MHDALSRCPIISVFGGVQMETGFLQRLDPSKLENSSQVLEDAEQTFIQFSTVLGVARVLIISIAQKLHSRDQSAMQTSCDFLLAITCNLLNPSEQ
jgi:hypothetical protein